MSEGSSRYGLRATPRKTEHYGNLVETPRTRKPRKKSQFTEDLGDGDSSATDNASGGSARGRVSKTNGATTTTPKLSEEVDGSVKTENTKKKVIIDGWEVGTDPKIDANPVFEFGGNFGVTAIMVGFPTLMLYMFVGTTYYDGKFPTPQEGESYPAFFGHLASLIYHGAFPSLKAWTIYWTFFLFEMLAYCFLPGIYTEGKPLAHEGGKRLQYYCSAMWSFYTTIIIAAVLHFTGLFPLYTLLDEFGPIMSVAIISGFGVSLIAYFSAIMRGAQHRMTGHFIYDFFMGAELNPRIGRLDFKMFFEVRLPWYILLGMTCATAARQYEEYGYVSGEVCFLIMAHYLYANACSKGEEYITPTWDMYFEKWGFMLIFWNMAGVPLTYCYATLHLANHPPSTYEMPRPLLYLLFVTYLFVYWVWDTTNSQKNRFRQQELGGPIPQRKAFPQLPWQVVENPRIIRTAAGDSILADGWYGYARKIHYTCDFFFAVTWALVAGFNSPFPWFYPVFFAGMIIHRAMRDIEKCRKKYGEAWTEYEKMVPYLFIPSKSGCPTCKIRHVRCDETRPACLNCKKTGRTCDYEHEKKIIEYLDTQTVSVIVPGTKHERRQFAFFTACTAPGLSGYFDEGFWDKFVLQVSFEIPALRHALLALSSLHESYQEGKDPRGTKDHDIQSKFAVKQYTQALGHLRKDLADGKQNHLVTLMACIVFVCFDSLRGNYDSAVIHIRSGMQITQNLMNLKTLSSSDAHFVRSSLMPLLKRLWLQALSFDNKAPEAIDDTWDGWISNTTVGEGAITTLEEARDTLNICMDYSFHYFYLSAHPNRSKQSNTTTEDTLASREGNARTFQSRFRAGGEFFPPLTPESNDAQQEALIRGLSCWKEKFNAFIDSRVSTFSNKETRAATLIEIHWMILNNITNRVVHQGDSHDEGSFYRIKPNLEKLLELCRGLIMAEQSDSQSTEISNLSASPTRFSESPPPFLKSIFSGDLGVVGPLYIIALRSRNTSLRWEAVSLLRLCKRREGMWDSEATADACVKVIKADLAREEGIGSSSSGSSPSQSNSPEETLTHGSHIPIRPVP